MTELNGPSDGSVRQFKEFNPLPSEPQYIEEPYSPRVNITSTKEIPARLILGEISFPDSITAKQVLKPELGSDRVTIVSFNRESLQSAIQNAGIVNPAFILDPMHPVVFGQSPSAEQSGFFYPFVEGSQLDEDKRNILKGLIPNPLPGKSVDLSRAIAQFAENEEMSELLKIMQNQLNNPDSDAYGIPSVLSEWLNGSEVYINNAGSFIRGKIQPVALAFKNPSEPDKYGEYKNTSLLARLKKLLKRNT